MRRNHPLRGRTFLPSGKLVEIPDGTDWNSLFLDDGVKERVRFHVQFLMQNAATLRDRLGVRSRRGIILSGPPGTGKTLIGRILADTIDATMLWVTPCFLTTNEDDIQQVLDLARMVAPVVLFLEDIDVFAEDRSPNATAFSLGELMNQASRNRPGRFDRVIEVPAPSPAHATAYLRARFAGHTLRRGDLAWFATSAAGRTGAELEELANTVFMLALQRAGGTLGDAGLAIGRDVLAAALSESPGGNGGSLGFGDAARIEPTAPLDPD